jgi:hypothetical protein
MGRRLQTLAEARQISKGIYQRQRRAYAYYQLPTNISAPEIRGIHLRLLLSRRGHITTIHAPS